MAWLTQENQLHNKFNYRLRCTPNAKEVWAEVQKGPSQSEQKDFVDFIMNHPAGTAPQQRMASFKKKTVVTDVKEEGIEGEWESYRAAITRDGQDVIDEKLTFGSMIKRRDPDLPPTSQVKEPWCWQVARKREGWSGAVPRLPRAVSGAA